MPPWARGSGSAAAGGTSLAAYARSGSSDADVAAELARVRSSFDDVCRERDRLRHHVATMEKLVQEQVGKAVAARVGASRPTSAPPRGRSYDGDGANSALAGSARRRGAHGSEHITRSGKLRPEGEVELLQRLHGKYWKVTHDQPGSGA